MSANRQEQCSPVNERVVRGLSWGLNDNWVPGEGYQPKQYPHPESERPFALASTAGVEGTLGARFLGRLQQQGGAPCPCGGLLSDQGSSQKEGTEKGGKPSLISSLVTLGGGVGGVSGGRWTKKRKFMPITAISKANIYVSAIFYCPNTNP